MLAIVDFMCIGWYPNKIVNVPLKLCRNNPKHSDCVKARIGRKMGLR